MLRLAGMMFISRLSLIRLSKQYGPYATTARSVNSCEPKAGPSITRKSRGFGVRKTHSCRIGINVASGFITLMRRLSALRPLYANYVWSIDFVHDKLSNGRPYKMLTVLDEYTREALSGYCRHSDGFG